MYECARAGEGIAQLSAIRDITKASQLSNMAAYLPTDCPTREKHSWTGDASVTAEQAMYNLFNPAGVCVCACMRARACVHARARVCVCVCVCVCACAQKNYKAAFTSDGF